MAKAAPASTAPATGVLLSDATVHPQKAPLHARAIKPTGRVRAGALGERSPTYSASASAPKTYAKGVSRRMSHKTAGAVNVRNPQRNPKRIATSTPATSQRSRAKKRKSRSRQYSESLVKEILQMYHVRRLTAGLGCVTAFVIAGCSTAGTGTRMTAGLSASASCTPCRRRAARRSPRARSETSCPAPCRRAANRLPVTPAPYTSSFTGNPLSRIRFSHTFV